LKPALRVVVDLAAVPAALARRVELALQVGSDPSSLL
jgi:hypothetical protein